MKFMTLKKLSLFLTLLFTYIFCLTTLNAATNKIEIISTNGGEVNLGTNGGKVTKTIVASDKEKGELTVEVKVSNAEITDIFFIIDNSSEIGELGTLKTTIINSTKTFVEELHDNLDNIKTGLLMLHPYGTSTTNPVNGGLISELSENKSETLSSLDNLQTTAVSNGQDFLEVLNKAKDSFSEEAENKIIVLITSGIDSTNIETYKNELSQIGSEIQIITLVTENSDSYVEEMFGTEETPTTGKLYNIEESEVSSTLNTNVSSNIINLLPINKYQALFEDIFPSSIFNNFKIEYVGNPSQGVVGELNTTEKKFSWSIGDLTNNKIATFRYKLTLKDQVPANVKDIMLNVNESIYFEYKDDVPAIFTNTYQCSPIIKILVTNPKTGLYDYFIPATLIFSISILVISIIKRKELFIQI